ncbi:MAG: DegT/DnrJ/EryC1/StrS family aminotransferase [Proteobacteria bacterium]|nr:DegT/DnrJ/EryC1/StrS family aminotransferase [Pseudomonadota bacterium]MBU1738366.1 DegT/DnrJ/EryC1/StrS family aminotransferase [Pseudomonadota bacterium]
MTIPRRYIDTEPGELRRLLLASGSKFSDPDCPDPVKEWESRFAAAIGRRAGIVTGSGRFAMKLILAGLKLPRGSEVIIPAYTLKDLVPLITDLGLIPVTADIDPDHWNVTAESINRRITAGTSAILVLHLFGNPAPMGQIMELARAKGLKVIEDCAHAAGSFLDDRPTGLLGDAAFFSFESIKPINTYGGGMVVTDDPDLETVIRQAAADVEPAAPITAKVRAALFERFMFSTGLARIPLTILATKNGQQLITRLYRLIQPPPAKPKGYGPVQADLGLMRLKSLPARVEKRRRQAALLKAHLPDSCHPQGEIPGGKANYYFFVVKVRGDVNKIRKILLQNGYDAGIGAEIADDCAAFTGDTDCPEAATLFDRALHLPLHERLTDHQLTAMADLLNRICV